MPALWARTFINRRVKREEEIHGAAKGQRGTKCYLREQDKLAIQFGTERKQQLPKKLPEKLVTI